MGPSASAGKKVRPPTIRITPTRRPTNSPPVVGNVPSDGGTILLAASDPAIAIIGTAGQGEYNTNGVAHENIVTLLDAGTTPSLGPDDPWSGRLYFVMEFVEGKSITVHCDEECLSVNERLELMLPVCRAIQHAHLKGAIHRDIKPNNVLVTKRDERAVPKVIDFGLAKVVGGEEAPEFDEKGLLLGTLEYMGPEQTRNGEDVDSRTDVYGLGALLYTLLTGATPFKRAKNEPRSEFLRRIREEEVIQPSDRVAQSEESEQLARLRGTNPKSLAKGLRKDLDWIVLKALKKDPNERYQTAQELARDIERFLAREPVEAAPPSKTYRAIKFLSKHRRPLCVAGAFAIVLVSATAFSAFEAVRASQSEALALTSERQAQSILAFFRERVLFAPRPEGKPGGLGRDVKLREVIDNATASLDHDLSGQPKVEAAIRDTLGTSYLNLGAPANAVPQYERARELRRRFLGEDHPDTQTTMNNLAAAYQAAGRTAEALPIHEATLARSRAQKGRNHTDTLRCEANLATAYRLIGRSADAVPLCEHIWEVREARLGPSHRDTLVAMNNLALAYRAQGRKDEALVLHEKVLQRSRASLGPQDIDTLTALNNLAGDYLESDRPGEASPLLEEALQGRRLRLGPEHTETLVTTNNLGATLLLLGRPDESIALFQDVLPLREAKLGRDHLDTVKTRNNLGVALKEAGRATEAIPLLQQALAVRRVKLGANHAETLTTMNHLAGAFIATKRWSEAAELLRVCLTSRQRIPADWQTHLTRAQLGEALSGTGNLAEAREHLVAGVVGMDRLADQIPSSRKKELELGREYLKVLGEEKR